MDVTFDGPNKQIILGTGLSSFDVKDLYSHWKVWVLASDNAKYLEAFRSVGGDPLVGAVAIAPYYFLLNGWRIQPNLAATVVDVAGNLFVDGGGSPFLSNDMTHPSIITMLTSQNSTTEVVSTGGSALTSEEHNRLYALPTTNDPAVEGGLTVTAVLRILLAVLAGKSTVAGAIITFRDLADSKARVTATVNATTGERTAVSRDAN